MTVPTIELGDTARIAFGIGGGSNAGGAVDRSTFATVATVATFAFAPAFADADLRTGFAVSPASRLGRLVAASAGTGDAVDSGGGRVAAGFLAFEAFATATGLVFTFSVTAVGATVFGDLARVAGFTTGASAAFFSITTATSGVSVRDLRGAGFFAVAGVTAASFTGAGLRALLDGAFGLATGVFGAEAGVIKALEAVDFAVFFVVNL